MAVILAFLVATARAISQGWLAVSDDAAIAIRSSDALTRAGPSVGQATMLGHGVFNPGPLQYWLLAVPVHIDAQHGVLWGAALWCTVAGMITVEAARSVAGPVAGVVAALLVVWLVAWVPLVALNPVWNPYMGAIFFFATIGCAFAVMSGNPLFWPLAVFVGSVATQTHLVYSLSSVGLLVLSGVIGVARARRARQRLSWLLAGLVVGGACWIVPLLQEALAHPANLTLILKGVSGQRPMGLAFGLRTLVATTFPHPVWWTPVQHLALLDVIRGAPFGAAFFVIGLTAVAVVVGVWSKHRALVALAAIGCCLEACLVITYGNISANEVGTIGTLLVLMLPVGFVFWLVACWSLVVMTECVAKFVWTSRLGIRARGRNFAAGFLTCASMAALILFSLIAQVQQDSYGPWMVTPQSTMAVRAASDRIESLVRRGPIGVDVRASEDAGSPSLSYTLGIVWALKQCGWSPSVASDVAVLIGGIYAPRGKVPVAHVLITSTKVTVLVTPVGRGVLAKRTGLRAL